MEDRHLVVTSLHKHYAALVAQAVQSSDGSGPMQRQIEALQAQAAAIASVPSALFGVFDGHVGPRAAE